MKKKLRILAISLVLIMQSFFGLTPISFAEEDGESLVDTEVVVGDGEELTEVESDEEFTEEENSLLAEPMESEMEPMATPPAGVMLPGDVIKNTEFTVGGQLVEGTGPVTVQNGQTAEFKFNLELAAGHSYGPGTTLSYTLPDIFSNITFPQGTKFGSLGDITKNGNDIIIIFNEDIIDELGGGTAFEPGAHFYIAATFSNISNDVNATISLPGQENIKLNFTPLGGSSITKNNGVPHLNNQNSEYIKWTVTVNTDLSALGTVTFTDTLTANNSSGHTFDQASVTITELTMKPDGTSTRSSTTGISLSFNEENTVMTIDLDGTKAYEITYNTIPDDPGNNESVIYRNSAQYGTTNVGTKSATVQYGTPLSKEVSSYPTSSNLATEWTIKYNFNKRTITQENAVLTDSWSTSGGSGTGTQVMSDFTVYEENGTTPTTDSWTKTDNGDGQGFTLQFNQNVTKPYVIKYKTTPTTGTYITSDMTVTNMVTRSDINITKKPSVKYFKNDFMLNKTEGSVNYTTKTMDWTITANQARYNLAAGTVFTDTFPNWNMELQEGSLEVSVGGTKLTSGYTVQKTNYTDADNNVHVGKGGFTVTLENATSQRVVITYTTDYDIRDVGSNNRQFQNNVAINNSSLPAVPSDSATHSVASEQTANGKKDGKYNYATKQFEWEVELNFNYNTLTNAIFEDVLPNTQTIDVASIKVVEGTLNSAGVFQPGDEVEVTNTATEPNKIKFSLGEISVPYKVTYNSYDTDGVFPETTGKVQITNTATLKDGTNPNASWTKIVGVNYTDKLIKKNGSQLQSTAGIKWNFEFNYAQSDIKNIVITDTVGKDGEGNPNQLIKPDSFKVYEVRLSGKSDIANFDATKQNTLLTDDEYELDINIQAGTFELKLPDGDSAYYIEYETIYLGANNSTVQNEVVVNYVSNDGAQASNSISINNFRYGNAGTTVKVPFIVVKTDGATGEPLKDVEFTLYSDFQPGVALISKKTDENGIFDLGMKLTEGTYTLKETTVTGYDNPGDISFKLDRNSVAVSGPYLGKQIVEVENFKTGQPSLCSAFTLTVKDVDRNFVANQNVTLTNKATGQMSTFATSAAGTITLNSATTKAGIYTVTIKEAGTDVALGEVTVTYNGTCQYELQPEPACEQFEITIEDKNHILRSNVTVTLKHKTDNTAPEITRTTDENGQFTVPSGTTQTGVYKVYEGKQYLGDVTITYKNSPCAATVTEVPTCETCTLIVKDVDGNPRGAGVLITIKDKDGAKMGTALTTDSAGKVQTTIPLPAGEYDVFEGDSEEPFATFTTNIDCENVVQPEPTCEYFTVAIRDVDGNLLEKGIIITLKNKVTNQEAVAETDENGKVSILSKNLPAGQYDVYNSDIKLGELTVSYKTSCTAEIQQAPSCEVFTLSVRDDKGNPFTEGVTITLKDSEDNQVATATTDEKRKVKIPSDKLPAGTYSVYADGEFLSEIVVSYKNSCNAAILKLTLLDDKGKIFEQGLIDKVIIKQDGNDKDRDVNEDGIFTVEGLEPGEHEFAVIVEVDGKKLVMGKIKVTINSDGEVTNISEELVDPYGKITDSKTGDVIGGVEVELYYADTVRNRAKGRTPGTVVDLPELPGFAPNSNKNPQTSVSVPIWNDDVSDYGNYAWLVFPETDYYIVAKKPGYRDYISEVISVEWDIVKYDFAMDPIPPVLGGGGGGWFWPSNPSQPNPSNPADPNDPNNNGDLNRPTDPNNPNNGSNPGNPADPNDPNQSGSGEDGTNPDGGKTPNTVGDTSSKDPNSSTENGAKLPQTGEERNGHLLVSGILFIFFGASLILVRRKTKVL